MEDTLREPDIRSYDIKRIASLNPCFNGRYSQSYGKLGKHKLL